MDHIITDENTNPVNIPVPTGLGLENMIQAAPISGSVENHINRIRRAGLEIRHDPLGIPEDPFIWPISNEPSEELIMRDIENAIDSIVQSRETPTPAPARFTTRITDEMVNEMRRNVVASPLSDIYTGFYKTEEKKHEDDDFVSLKNGGKDLHKNCVCINGHFYRKNDNDIVLDYFNPMNHILKSSSNIVYSKFKNDGTVDETVLAFYRNPNYDKPNVLPIVRLYDEKNLYLVDYNQIPKEFYNECFRDLSFYHVKLKRKVVSKKELKIKARKSYNIYKPSHNKSNLTKDYLMGVISPSFIKTEGKRYTFGIELETISGIVPNYIDETLNYQSIRDGSLKNEDGEEYGYEYVTGVLIGDTGLLQTKRLCNILTERCIVDIKCGMHIHLGGVTFTSELIVYLYKLYLMVEKEIFSMVPLSRKNNEYCKKLKWFNFKFDEESFNNPNKYNSEIESYYNMIYKFVSAKDLPSNDFNKKSQHPLGAKCGYNHSTARYCWINFVPTLFNTRGNRHYTVENRIHQGTTNFKKVKNWTLINMGLLWFAENHKKAIALNDKISLCDIMKLAYPKSHLEINEYINEKTEKFNKQDDKENKQSELDSYVEVVDSEDLTIKKL